MTYYSVEVCYKYPKPIKNYCYEKNFPHNDKDSESYKIKIELETLSSKYNGEMSAFDYDFIFNTVDYTFNNISSVNYNYYFDNMFDVNNFILNLPSKYDIIWIYRKDKNKKGEIECVIYMSDKKSDFIKFDDNDKIIYKNILDRIKNTKK